MYDPAPYDHYRPTDDVTDPGVYRVVGRPDGEVTLLRVADAEGNRVHSGRVERHPETAFPASFERADNPDDRPALTWARRLGFALVFGGAAAQLLDVGGPWTRWIALAGAVLLIGTVLVRRFG